MNRLNLPDVTVCAVDCLNPMLAARALAHSSALCDFADVILLTDSEPSVSSPTRVVKIDRIGSSAEYSRFMLKELHRHIATPWVLIVQWDGYVLQPRAWRPDFLDYDYIGPRWPWFEAPQDVGNGGFSLRSLRLLKLLARPDVPTFGDSAEDVVICRALRPALEAAYGIRFAPAEIADPFGYEHALPNAPTFGFHGAFNMWRHTSDADMIELFRAMDRRTFASREFAQLMFRYFELRKFDCMGALYTRIMETQEREHVIAKLGEAGVPPELAAACLDMCARAA
ncbi:hypothetical protein AWB76_00999 [Caballeronia temeraria]|uniref:DUF5672 domain-containing protein n=1 Tax=Caballeronia temeraria TaxID=1777137 RepID=A0A157ZNB0_9BURK|nr:DUF5672 family protein [Caballeronia temeraria]SAK46983.1 hypothetical protein AWB76_00999 [Caballeronia temeraria]